jgi:hypothetical protein
MFETGNDTPRLNKSYEVESIRDIKLNILYILNNYVFDSSSKACLKNLMAVYEGLGGLMGSTISCFPLQNSA